MSLILHCGGYAADYQTVAAVRTPAATGTHYPIGHDRLVDLVRHYVAGSGYDVVRESFGLQTDGDVEGSNLFGLFELRSAGGIDARDYSLVVGVRNSHTRKFAASIAIGSRVLVCDNLAFSGEIKIARRHTTNIDRDLPQCVSAAVGGIHAARVRQDERIAAYRQAVLDQRDADHLVVECLRARVLPSQDVLKVIREFEAPSHEEHLAADGKRTVWTLFNAITEASTKGTNIFALPRKAQALHGVCDVAAGLTIAGLALDGVEDAEVEDNRAAA